MAKAELQKVHNRLNVVRRRAEARKGAKGVKRERTEDHTEDLEALTIVGEKQKKNLISAITFPRSSTSTIGFTFSTRSLN